MKKFLAFSIAFCALALVSFVGVVGAQNTLVWLAQGGGTLTVESGGVINVKTGGEIQNNGTPLDLSSGIATSTSATTAELDVLAGVTPGTVTAGKAVVTTTNKHIDALVISDGGLALGSGAGTAVTSTAAELNYVDVTAAGTAQASKAAVLGANKNLDTLVIADGGLKLGAGAGTAVGATAAEINNAADVSARVQTITSSGAVTAGVQSVQLNHATVVIAATIADAANHQGLFIVKDTSASGTEAHTLTLTAGTFNGTNTVATLNAPNEALVVYFDSAGNGTIVENIGSVGLSGP